MRIWKAFKSAVGIGAVGTAGYGTLKLKQVWDSIEEKLGDLALPAVATAGAGLIGGLLGNGKIAGLAMAVTGVGFALNHISKNGLPGADLIADATPNTAPTPAGT